MNVQIAQQKNSCRRPVIFYSELFWLKFIKKLMVHAQCLEKNISVLCTTINSGR